MRIIVEGPDGVGKTTFVQKLADHFNCDIIRMTEKGSKNYFDYMAKSDLKNIVSDRSFLSEIAYSLVFDRTSNLRPGQLSNLIKEYIQKDWKIIILDAKTETIVDRLMLRGDEDEYKIRRISDLRMAYKALAYWFDLTVIDTEKNSIEDIIKELEEIK